MPRLLPDITPLQTSREFRLLWSGQLVSQAGSAVRLVAIPYQIYVLTGSSLAVGLTGLFSAIPLIVFSLFGGVIADRMDRRRLLLMTQTSLALVSTALAVATMTNLVSVPLLYVLTAIGASVQALDNPARSAMAPGLVERRLIPAAMALNQSNYQVAGIVGPAFAGVLIASYGIAPAYWVDVATFVISLAAIFVMHTPPYVRPADHPPVLRSLADGWRFLAARPLLFTTMAVDFFATFFGIARALMPYFADKVFHVGPEGLGILYAAPSVGATAVALTSGWTAHVSRRGIGILVAVAVFGLSTAAFAFVPPTMFLLACLMLAISNGADMVSAIFRHTILQLETPDEYRGRLSAINLVFVAGGPQLGQVEAGVVADLFTPEISVITGGLACLGVVFFAGLVPQVVRYRATVEEPAPA